MSGEPRIGLGDELTIKALLASAGLVACHQQDRPPLRIESERSTPFAVCSFEPQLFHVGVLRPLKRISMRPAELGIAALVA